MKNTTHRVIILKNVDSELISQAILILKDTASGCDAGVMEEAERVVAKYMGTSYCENKIKRTGKSPVLVFMISAAIAFASVVAALWFIK